MYILHIIILINTLPYVSLSTRTDTATSVHHCFFLRSAHYSTAFMRFYDRTHLPNWLQHCITQFSCICLKALSATCTHTVWSCIAETERCLYYIAHCVMSSLNQDRSAALSYGWCHCCVRFVCIKSTLWLCVITNAEDKVRGCLLAEWRYLSELKQNMILLL